EHFFGGLGGGFSGRSAGGRAPRGFSGYDFSEEPQRGRDIDAEVTVPLRDARCELPVWDYEAALGAEITAPTLDGRVSLKIPPESQTGRVMRLRGRGLPGWRGKEPGGDLLYELKVLAPTGMTDDERKLMQDFAARRRARGVPDPRAELMRE